MSNKPQSEGQQASVRDSSVQPWEDRLLRSRSAWILVAGTGVVLELVGAVMWLNAGYAQDYGKGQVVMIAGLSLLVIARLVQASSAPVRT